MKRVRPDREVERGPWVGMILFSSSVNPAYSIRYSQITLRGGGRGKRGKLPLLSRTSNLRTQLAYSSRRGLEPINPRVRSRTADRAADITTYALFSSTSHPHPLSLISTKLNNPTTRHFNVPKHSPSSQPTHSHHPSSRQASSSHSTD